MLWGLAARIGNPAAFFWRLCPLVGWLILPQGLQSPVTITTVTITIRTAPLGHDLHRCGLESRAEKT